MESLSDRIADVRRKAVEFADAEDNTHLSNREWYERIAAYVSSASPDLIIQMADRIEELEKERDEVRNKALDEAAHCLQTSTFRLNSVAVVRACVALILALKSKEPKP